MRKLLAFLVVFMIVNVGYAQAERTQAFIGDFVLSDDYLKNYIYFREYTDVNGASPSNLAIGLDGRIDVITDINTCNLNVDEEKIMNEVQIITELKDEAEKNGVPFLFVYAPANAEIYPEYFPQLQNDHSFANEKLADKLKERGVNVVYPVSLLRKAKAVSAVYYKLDSHWNEVGSMIVANEIAKQSAKWFTKLRFFSNRDFSYSTYKRFSDRLSDWLSMNEYVTEETHVIHKKHKMKSKDKPKMLACGDSYMFDLRPALDHYFSSVGDFKCSYDIHGQRNHDSMKEILTKVKPDIVIYEIAGRLLCHFMTGGCLTK